MQLDKPKFMDSEYFICEFGKWSLSEDAPDELKEEFKKFMKNLDY